MAEGTATEPGLIFGVSGASGAVLADATAQALLRRGVALEVVCSDYGELMWFEETGERFRDAVERWSSAGAVTLHRPEDVAAPISALMRRRVNSNLRRDCFEISGNFLRLPTSRCSFAT